MRHSTCRTTLLMPVATAVAGVALLASGAGSAAAASPVAHAPVSANQPTAATSLTLTGGAGSVFDHAVRRAATAVSIQNFAFSPATVNVKQGTTVTWTNQDQAPHDVTGPGFSSPMLDTGVTFSHTFSTPGTFPYVCTIHPSMKGTVTVTP
jgi:plastocyanin